MGSECLFPLDDEGIDMRGTCTGATRTELEGVLVAMGLAEAVEKAMPNVPLRRIVEWHIEAGSLKECSRHPGHYLVNDKVNLMEALEQFIEVAKQENE